jgi:secreted trypsin-like serine protease
LARQASTEGALSGEVAAKVVNNYFGCISVPNYTGVSGKRTECNIVKATSSGIASQEGDSGGPVVRYSGGNLMVTGIVSAGDGATAGKYNIQYDVAVDQSFIGEFQLAYTGNWTSRQPAYDSYA